VPLPALRLASFVAAGLLTGGAIMLTGPVGFIGLVAPHMARLIGGPRHRPLVMQAALLGAIGLVLADILVRVIDTSSGRMPIGVVTSLLGAPIFLALLLREMRGGLGFRH
ncbi:MAG: iron chelate uptake ABC transporter family permease subunit, partial [Phycisphaerales bacterium]|nr:iron chelate uptake ABC transporter family permease subunit [Phycisphaerales bacterium]